MAVAVTAEYGTVAGRLLRTWFPLSETVAIGEPIKKASVIFTPSIPRSTSSTEVFIADQVIAYTDEDGYLCNEDGSRGINLLATDSNTLSHKDWTWKVVVSAPSINSIAWSIQVPKGVVTDLATAIPLPENMGDEITQWEQLKVDVITAVAEAQESATNASNSASSASTSASSAASSKNSAETASSNATTQATLSSTKATAAATSASNAATSASNAATSASSAATSKSQAAASATTAQGAAVTASEQAGIATTAAVRAEQIVSDMEGWEPDGGGSSSWSAITGKPSVIAAGESVVEARAVIGAVSVEDLPDVSGFATTAALTSGLAGKQDAGDYATTASLSTVATTGAYADLTGKPTIPVTPDLSGYATTAALTEGLATKQPVGDYATTAALTSGLAGKQPVGDYATRAELPDVSGLATTAYVDQTVGDIDTVLSGILGGE